MREAIQTRLQKLRLAGELNLRDYNLYKAECNETITHLEARMAELVESNQTEPPLEKAFSVLCRVDEAWDRNSTELKRVLIGSMFTDKLVLQKGEFEPS